ncbi:unnamed protein product [Clonostachys rosea]|uniref:Protein kinase domain-containing protein n=1 Tax=Bionectria ochroleuca TaxID=29856 RepID=A0ABY6UF66_BIOOC|nr:unnamed protein product [Clonostachys rosea]
MPYITDHDHLRAPEAFFGGSFDFTHDLWRTGCVIFSLFFKRPPFPKRDPFSDEWRDHMLLRYQARLLGAFPSKWSPQFEMIAAESIRGGEREEWLRNSRRTAFGPRPGLLDKLFQERQMVITKRVKESTGCPEDDCGSLGDLLPVIQGLMQHDPDCRMLPQKAAALIKWSGI